MACAEPRTTTRTLPAGLPDFSARGWMNSPLLFGDVTVEAGDLIVGDTDGVVAIPRTRVEEVAQKSREREDKEAETMRAPAGPYVYSSARRAISPAWLSKTPVPGYRLNNGLSCSTGLKSSGNRYNRIALAWDYLLYDQ